MIINYDTRETETYVGIFCIDEIQYYCSSIDHNVESKYYSVIKVRY